MAIREPNDVSAIFFDDEFIEDALNAAVRDSVQLHKEKGRPLVVRRDGKIVWISPEEAEKALISLTPSAHSA